MDLAAIGVNAAKSDVTTTPLHKGRVLQADADFFAYECARLEESVNENFHVLKQHLEVKRKMAGAEFINVHLTLGLKGGRDQIATVKPYQENRSGSRDPLLQARVRELRVLMANYRNEFTTPVVNLLQEADDSLTQYQVRQIALAGVDSSVIMSGDKDLWMVEGLHCDPKTARMYTVKGYGKCEYKDVGNKEPKLVGAGTSWFWHQMIMGDTADNIAGLPKLSGRLANRYLPTKKIDPQRKAVACGEAKAVAILKDVTNDKEAAKRVFECYEGYYGGEAMAMLFESAFLLWMRRTSAVLDVLDYLRSVDLPYTINVDQKTRLKRFKELAKLQINRGEAF